MAIDVGPGAFDSLGLKTIFSLLPTFRILKVPVEITDENLSSDFTKAARLFVNASAKIIALKDKITQLKLDGSSSDFYSGHLIIGQESSAAELDAVLNMIK